MSVLDKDSFIRHRLASHAGQAYLLRPCVSAVKACIDRDCQWLKTESKERALEASRQKRPAGRVSCTCAMQVNFRFCFVVPAQFKNTTLPPAARIERFCTADVVETQHFHRLSTA